jgi:hypothetical protein
MTLGLISKLILILVGYNHLITGVIDKNHQKNGSTGWRKIVTVWQLLQMPLASRKGRGTSPRSLKTLPEVV